MYMTTDYKSYLVNRCETLEVSFIGFERNESNLNIVFYNDKGQIIVTEYMRTWENNMLSQLKQTMKRFCNKFGYQLIYTVGKVLDGKRCANCQAKIDKELQRHINPWRL